MRSIYLETSVISYLVGKHSLDLVVVANQQITARWWDQRRHRYQLFVSELVIDEADRGDQDAAHRRLDFMQPLTVLRITEAVTDVTEELIAARALPRIATQDALHIAIAAVHGIDFLMTWNCKHIANPCLREKIRLVLVRRGLPATAICTPYDLLAVGG